jgi:regulatory protein
MNANAGLSIKGRALRYLAQREYSRAELERKLMWALKRPIQRARGKAPHESASPDDGRAGLSGDDPPAFDSAATLAQINAALDELTAKGFLSDERTATQLLASKGVKFGVNRLRRELQSKGLGEELVASTLGQARQDELPRAQEVWRRKFGEVAADAKERGKQMRFLAGRGFSSDVIARVLRHELPEDG